MHLFLDLLILHSYDVSEKNVVVAGEEIRKITEDIEKIIQRKRKETEAIFGEQGEDFEKELQEWATAEKQRQIEIAQIEKQDAIAENLVTASVDSASEPSENKIETQKTSEKKTDNKKDTKSNEPYYIEHNGKKYYDNDGFKIPFKRRNYERFVMGNLPDSTLINWTLYERGADKKILESHSNVKNRSNAKTFNFTKKESDIATFLSLEAQAETEGKPKVEIFIEKEVKKFTYKDLKAIDDKNKNRVAKNGETLYYIHKTGKSSDTRFTKFQIDISPKVAEDEIPTNHIEWIYNGTNIDHDKLSLSRTIHYKGENKSNIEVQARTGNPMAGEYKKVKVEWVDRNYNVISFVNKLDEFLKVFQIINEVSKKFGKVIPCEAALLKDIGRNLTWQWTTENKEDEKSRHILQEKKFEFIVSADNIAYLKCGKELKVSAFGKSFELGKLYAEIGIGANVIIENEEIYYLETNKLQSENKKSAGGIEVKGEIGLTVGGGYKQDGKLLIGAYGGGKINITGGGKVEYPYNGNKNLINFEAYINPLLYNFTAEVKLGPLNKELSFSGILIDTRIKKRYTKNLSNEK